MKIALIGSHCVGKTSLFKKMQSCIEFENFDFYDELVREIRPNGFRINELSNDASQLVMCAYHLQHLQSENFVSDRCLLDNWVYAYLLSRKNELITYFCVEVLFKYFIKTRNDIDLYIYCPPEFAIESDKFRMTDKDFIKEVDEEIKRCMRLYLNKDNLLCVSGSTDERFEQVLNKIKELKNASIKR